MLKFCKILTPLNPVLVYKKPRIHPKIPKPNGPHPLGFEILWRILDFLETETDFGKIKMGEHFTLQ